MRNSFIQKLTQMAETDERIVLLVGDLGYSVIEEFREKFPKRFYNVGIAEQNMLGLATGLAKSGFIPYVYSIVPFAALRPYEFIRNGPVLHELPVRIVGVGGGFEYGTNGPTHWGLDDLGVMRIQPGMTVLAPTNNEETMATLEATHNLPGPVYYRLCKDNTPATKYNSFEWNQVNWVLHSAKKNTLVLYTGAMGNNVMEAVKDQHLSISVASVTCLNPVPSNLVNILKQYSEVVTVESHYSKGGLGSMVCELVATNAIGCMVKVIGVEKLSRCVGSRAFMEELHGLSPQGILAKIIAG